MSAAAPAVLESAANVPTIAEPAFSVVDLPAPRRVAIAALSRQILATEQELGAMYAAAAQRTPIAYLRTAFGEFAEAKRRRVPAYVVFHDSTLEALAVVRPRDRGALLSVPGIGPTKAETYGQALLKVLAGPASET